MSGRNTVRAVSPNQPKTPLLVVRVPEPMQDEIKARAARLGVTVSDVVRDLLRRGLDAGD